MGINKISFTRKILFHLGKRKFKNHLIKCSFFFGLILHLLNIIFILGGWVFVAYYFDIMFKFKLGYISSILSIIFWIIFNLIYIYFMPCKYEKI